MVFRSEECAFEIDVQNAGHYAVDVRKVLELGVLTGDLGKDGLAVPCHELSLAWIRSTLKLHVRQSYR
jgi:hypothetical protein